MQIRLYSQRYRSRSARLCTDYRDSSGSARSVPAERETRVEPHTRNSNVDEQLVANSLNPGFCGEQSTQSKSCSRVWGRQRDQYVLLHVRALGTAQSHENETLAVATRVKWARVHGVHTVNRRNCRVEAGSHSRWYANESL